jgi:hypothetical protein
MRLVELAERRQLALSQLVEIYSKSIQDASCDALPLASQADEQVFGTHSSVAKALHLIHSERERPSSPRHQLQVLRGWRRAMSNVTFDSCLDLFESDTVVDQVLRCCSVCFPEQSEKQVFSADVIVAEPVCFFGGQLKDASSSIVEQRQVILGAPAWTVVLKRGEEEFARDACDGARFPRSDLLELLVKILWHFQAPPILAGWHYTPVLTVV